MLLVWIGRYYLSTFDLVYSTQGVDLGAFYTDVHANLPVLYVLMAVAGITAVLVVAGIFRAGLTLPLGAIGVWILLGIGGAIYPVIVQNLIVQPNEISKEERYLRRNIQMTRYAYGLDAIDEQQFPASAQATEQEVAANQDTIDNVRLWDPQPLRAALRQIQTIRPLFDFLDVDVDRYVIDGQYKQVMLSARELDPSRLPVDAQTWVNSRLQFTHGYGYAVAAVNEAESDGTPKLIERDIPLQGPLSTDRPELYFGEQPDRYIIVNGNEPEFTPDRKRRKRADEIPGPGRRAPGQLAAQGRVRLEVRRPQHPHLRGYQRQEQSHLPSQHPGPRPHHRAIPATRCRPVFGGRPEQHLLDAGRLHDDRPHPLFAPR